MKEVDLLGLQLEPTTKAPIVLLGEREAPNRILPVFVGPPEAAAIALALSHIEPPRPLTHDLMATLVNALDATVLRVEITEVTDQAFLAQLVIRTAAGDRHIDARPSDALALALRVDAPILVSDDVLEQSGVLPEEPTEVAIDAEVDQFRAFLDAIDPDDFVDDATADDPSEKEAALPLLAEPEATVALDVPGNDDGEIPAEGDTSDQRGS